MKKILIVLLLVFSILAFSVEVVITDVSPYSADYELIKYLVENRIMELDENGKFKPNLLMTRIDVARIIYNAIQLFNLESINDLLKQISEINNTTKLTKSLISGIDERINIVDEEQKNLSKTITKLSNDFENYKSTLSKIPILETGILTLNASISSLEEQLKNENLLNLEKRVSNLEENFVSKEDFEDIKNKVSLMENSLFNINKDLTQKIDSINEEIDNVKKDAKIKNDQVNVQLENLKNTVQNLSLSFSSFNDKLNYLDEIYLNLKDFDFAKLKNLDDFQEMKLKVENFENSLTSINERLKNFEKLENKINSFDSDINLLNMKLNTLSESFNELETKLSELNNKVIKLDPAIERISELETKVEKLEKLEIDGSKLSEISRNIENFSSFIDETSSNIDNLNKNIKKLDSKIYILTILAGSSILLAFISFMTALLF